MEMLNLDMQAEQQFAKGISFLQRNDYHGASIEFAKAVDAGHVSAAYNQSLINGMGVVSPYDIDYAIKCFRQAASGGHPKAEELLLWLDKAQDTSFGTNALSMFASQTPADGSPNHILMMVGATLYNSLCQRYEAIDSVIEYELDAASSSEHIYVQKFVARTGVPEAVYAGGLNRLDKGSPADQITDGLNSLYFSLRKSGHSEELCLMIRCTIVGYIILKSQKYQSEPLLGIDHFFD